MRSAQTAATFFWALQLVVLIVYDLPNRDCHAKASNGEICCTYNSDGTCNYGGGGTYYSFTTLRCGACVFVRACVCFCLRMRVRGFLTVLPSSK